MSAATASIADVSRRDFTNRNDSRTSEHSQAQCTPVPLPAIGTQKIIRGNGTNVGTVISLQCPAKHKLVGSELTCTMVTNSTRWVGETYCKPLPPHEDFGFHVAVIASIISSGIILLMSMAFITCCVLDCLKKDQRRKQEREAGMWQWEEETQHQEANRTYYSHKGRNNNNNNSQEKVLSAWDAQNPVLCDNIQACRRHQHYTFGPPCMYEATPPHAALPGLNYDQPLVHQNSDSAQISGPPQYPGPPPYSCQTSSPSLVQISAVGSGVVWQYGPQSSLSRVNPPTSDESSMSNTHSAREFSIRIISV